MPGLNEIRFITLPRLSSLETKKSLLETDGRRDSNILERDEAEATQTL